MGMSQPKMKWPDPFAYGFSTFRSVKLRASFVQPESFGLLKVKEVEFKLGLGPCGRHVTELSYSINGDLLTIVQRSREPDDLIEPDITPSANAQERLALDRDLRLEAMRPWRKEISKPEFDRVIRDYRWGFWPIYEYVEKTPAKVVIEGALTKEEIAELEKVVADYRKQKIEWLERLETKKFIYKIADIHGRIEVINS